MIADTPSTPHDPARRHTVVPTVLGDLTIVGAGGYVEAVYFPGHWHRPDPGAFGPRIDDGFDEVAGQLTAYLAGERRGFDVPMRPRGDAIRLRVWELIAQVPYGATTTYGRLAAESDTGLDAQQVGAVVGRNPLSILVPCHRVVGSTGKLTGYAGGLRRKRFLLDLEQAHSDPQQPSLLGLEALA